MPKPREYPPISVVPSEAAQAAIHAFSRGNLVGPEPTFREPLNPYGQTGLGHGVWGQGPKPPAVHQPGGDLLNKIKHPMFLTVERTFRKLPTQAMFSPDLSPSRPMSFELGAYAVPDSMVLWVTDFSFSVYRLSGIDPGDWVPAEEGRFSGRMGFDLTVAATTRDADISNELDPSPGTIERQSFDRPSPSTPFGRGVGATEQQFVTSLFKSYANPAGAGSSLLPVRPGVYGPTDGPFTWVVDNGQRFAMSCVIFRRLTTPIAFIQGRLGGFLLHTSVSTELLDRMRPR